ncbi:DUF4349 domain-containing protein [Halalkalibacter okhensis]|uniref:DUF4349 domain-containing protein n=1 Tax=Halalkalibacter okhensis TaxID=333138 RepID=A0A0B0ID00_9BACI|nr:DUF4349 domain-containing protein [Halalkalibacter okhensis]KHF40433.1 hypothetical protein LQ50_09165 [Halalkalibacter okhensis]
MGTIKNYIGMVFLVFVISACSTQNEAYDFAVSDVEMTEEAEVVTSTEQNDMDSGLLNQISTQVEDRMVIYQGYVTLEVKDFYVARDDIKEKVNQLGGYVVESHQHEGEEGNLFGTIVLRVPKQDFQPFLEEIGSTDVKIVEQSTHGSDVTEEYVDVESRLNAKLVVEERLLGFMEQADNTENLLKISNDLAKVQEEIEQMTGRKQFLENQVELSTITITINEVSIGTSSIQGDDLNTWDRSKKLFIDTINVALKAFSSIIVFIIGLSPVFVPIVILIIIMLTHYKRKKKKHDQTID